MTTYQVAGLREDINNNVYSIYDGSIDSTTSKKEGYGTLKQYRKNDNHLLFEYKGWFHDNVRHGFGEHKNEISHSVGSYEHDLLKGYGFMKFLADGFVDTPQGNSLLCKKDDVFIGWFINNCPSQPGLWYHADAAPVVSLNPLSYYLNPGNIDVTESNIISNHHLFNVLQPIMYGNTVCTQISRNLSNEDGTIVAVIFFPEYVNDNSTYKGRIVTNHHQNIIKSVYYGDLQVTTSVIIPVKEGFGKLIEYDNGNIIMECIGKWKNNELISGTYKSLRDHDVPNQPGKKWVAGMVYTGELNHFMMHGTGELTITTVYGEQIIDLGTFTNHILEKNNNYLITKYRNNLLFHMEYKDNETTYNGDAVQCVTPTGIVRSRHGNGTYTCNDYKYTGEWMNDIRHGKGIFICKRNDLKYFPFEINDEYDGYFVNEVAEGTCSRWENRGKFIFKGEMVKNWPLIGEYESIIDHFRHDPMGKAVVWNKGWTYNGYFHNFMMHGAGGKLTISSDIHYISNESGTFINHILCKEEGNDYTVEIKNNITNEVSVTTQFTRDGVATKYIGQAVADANSNYVLTGTGKVFKSYRNQGYRVENGIFNGFLDPILDQQKNHNKYIFKDNTPLIPYKLMTTGVCVNPINPLQPKYSVQLERFHENHTFVGDVRLKYIRILHLSDTQNLHGTLTDLPDADILVHTGDFTKNGTRREYEVFNEWLGSISHRYKHRVVIPGDLDIKGIFDPDNFTNAIVGLLSNATVLMHKSIDINISDRTTLKLYGSPWCHGHDLERPGDTSSCRDNVTKKIHRFDEIPDDVDVLITHCAPRTVLDDKTDYNVLPVNPNPVRGGSSQHLFDAVINKKPKIHLFGHVQEQNGYWVKGNDGSYSNEIIGSSVSTPSHTYPCTLMSNNVMINKSCDAIIHKPRLILVPEKGLHGYGTLTVRDTNTTTTYTGRFLTDRFEPQDLDKTRDHSILTTRNNVAVHLVKRLGSATYDGEVMPGTKEGEYMRQGTGAYDCDRYSYVGNWVNDMRHGHGHYECKKAIFPFEAGDIVDGEFNNGMPTGSTIIWKRPNVFKYSGEFTANHPVSGEYESLTDHVGVKGVTWKKGVYIGEFQDFMMHGKGKLTLLDSNGIEISTSKGTFINHTLDILKDFIRVTNDNNVLHMEENVGITTYEGGVRVDASGSYIKHGRGIYDCNTYRYEGGWQLGVRHDHHHNNIFTCKVTKPQYLPLEAGDTYEGAFDTDIPNGHCIRWENRGKFRFSGIITDKTPSSGVYESYSDHNRGIGVQWKKGMKYEGEYSNFMMHGRGILTESDNGVVYKRIGYFVNHQLDKGNDYRILTSKNNIVSKIEMKTGSTIYDGEVIPGSNEDEYKRHGHGVYNCDRYSYVGNWANDMRHGRGRFECKQQMAVFEAGDIVEGEFDNGMPTGSAIVWTRPNVFRYTGEVKDNCLVSGEYESFTNHLRGNGIAWNQGWKYKGEFKDFMMHGQGKLTIFDSNGAVNMVSIGSFASHNIDITKDYNTYIYTNNVVVRMKTKVGCITYDGDVQARYGTSDYMKHGRGTYECESYRYEGGWHQDTRHDLQSQDSIFLCKQTGTNYSPFEAGDKYQGGFNMRIPEGNCVWKRPHKFIYRGTMSNGRIDTGEQIELKDDVETGNVLRYRDGEPQ